MNGKKIGKTHNMFKTYSFDVTDVLIEKNNILLIRLAAPMKEVYKNVPNAKEIMSNLRGAFHVNERLITRKMQMSYGWDNVPRIITTGIYRPVKLRVCEAARIDNVWFRTKLKRNYTNATALVDIELKGNSDFKGDVEVILERGNKKYSSSQKVTVMVNQTITSNVQIKIPDPELWWPSGLGNQPMYSLQIYLRKDGIITDSYSEKVAIREIKVVTTPIEKRVVNYEIGNPKQDTSKIMDGGSVGSWSKLKLDSPEEVNVSPFKFYVNGRFVFIKGFDMQPLDVFETKISREKYYRTVSAVKECGSNMIRVWGGGNVENPAFYDACDELGILVWQDFFFASGQYPNNDRFLKEIEDETINIVKHLRNRACLSIWCGDNESDMVNHDKGVGQFSNKITHVVQKRVLAEYDPDRYWHPSSPSGGGYPRSPWGGDKRNWGSGYPFRDYTYIRGDEARFISEGGTAGIPQLSTIRKFIPQQYEWPVTNDYYNMHWGDVPTMRRNFPDRIWKNVTIYFGEPQNITEYIYLTQIFQANGDMRMAQHFRKNMGECGGMLFWKWASTWPSVCLSVMDYYEYKKAAWYMVKKAFAPTSLMISNDDDKLSVWYINDLETQPGQNVVCQLKKTDGYLIKEWTKTLTFNQNSSGIAIDLDTTRQAIGSGEYYLKIWVANNDMVDPYYYTPADMINMKTVPGNVTAFVKRIDASSVEVTFKADEFSPFLLITSDNPYIKMSDNSFFIEKGEEKKIKISVPSGELWGDFTYTWWKGATNHFIVGSELLKPVPKKH
jgi:beta-mannosidase